MMTPPRPGERKAVTRAVPPQKMLAAMSIFAGPVRRSDARLTPQA
jgi:hypothetical protein